MCVSLVNLGSGHKPLTQQVAGKAAGCQSLFVRGRAKDLRHAFVNFNLIATFAELAHHFDRMRVLQVLGRIVRVLELTRFFVTPELFGNGINFLFGCHSVYA